MQTRFPYKTLQWVGDSRNGWLRLIDQTRLPAQEVDLDCYDVKDVWHAIKRLSVRGAPAIGIAAAYGCVLAAREGSLASGAEYLASSRPTAVNLFWAIDRMKSLGTDNLDLLLAEARRIHEEDAQMCQSIGLHGLPLIREGAAVLTHCNAGALATGGIGTATAPMYAAHDAGVKFRIYADETRPLLQGARLTAWELGRAGLDVTVVCDNMAAPMMRQGMIQLVIVGADRIAANGDTANKIGTYGVAVLASHHGIPFYVAAPSTTFDLSCATGDAIPIEQRDAQEVTHISDRLITPENCVAYNPAFDITPAPLIRGIITELGVIQPVNEETIRSMLRPH